MYFFRILKISSESLELILLYIVVFSFVGFLLGHMDGRITERVDRWKKKYKK